MDWLAQLLHLPPHFLSSGGGTGVIQSTASEATLVALLAAKARAMQDRPPADVLRLVAYCSDQAHSSGGAVLGSRQKGRMAGAEGSPALRCGCEQACSCHARVHPASPP